MHREHEYKHLADNARKRGGEEQNAQGRSVGSFANGVALKSHLNLSLNLRPHLLPRMTQSEHSCAHCLEWTMVHLDIRCLDQSGHRTVRRMATIPRAVSECAKRPIFL